MRASHAIAAKSKYGLGSSRLVLQDTLSHLFRRPIAQHPSRVFEFDQEGKKKVTRKTFIYNTDIVIAVGFRVKGEWGKSFRMWAREVVRASYDPRDQIQHLLGRQLR